MKTFLIGFVVVALVALIIWPLASASNQEVRLRNQYTQKTSERTAFYDKLWKILKQKAQVALQNDSSFKRNVDVIMSGRKDGEGLLMKWVTESNPNANFSEVSALYKDLTREISAQREGFFEQEKVMQDIKLQHDNLLGMFPGSILFSILGRQPLEYKAITSDRTDDAIKTGKDNDVSVF